MRPILAPLSLALQPTPLAVDSCSHFILHQLQFGYPATPLRAAVWFSCWLAGTSATRTTSNQSARQTLVVMQVVGLVVMKRGWIGWVMMMMTTTMVSK